MRRSSLVCLSTAIVVLLAAAGAHAAGVTITNGVLTAGVHLTAAEIGSADGSVGITLDADGKGPGGASVDVLAVGTDRAAWGIKYTGASGDVMLANSSDPGASQQLTLKAGAHGKTRATASGKTPDGTLLVTRKISLVGKSNVLLITTTIKNVSKVTVDNIRYCEWLDPDPDYAGLGTWDSVNTVVTGSNAAGAFGSTVGGTGTLTLGICTSGGITRVASVGSFGTPNPDPTLASPVDPGGAQDDLDIRVASSVGSLAKGKSVTITTKVVLAGSLAAARTACGL